MSKTNTMTAGATASAAAVNQNFDELGMLGYAEITANQGSISAEADITGLSVTVTISAAFAAAGRKIKITGSGRWYSTVGTDAAGVNIYEDANKKKQHQQLSVGTAAGNGWHVEVVLTPTSGSHTYKLKAQRTGGTGTITIAADSGGSLGPAFILVEAI